MALDFTRLRSAADGWRGSFENLVRHLGRAVPPEQAQEFRHIHGAGGDGGIEAYWVLQDGSEIGYQAKFHMHARDIDWRAIDRSIETALKTHCRMTKMVIAVACDLTDRVAGRNSRTGWQCFEAHRQKWNELVEHAARHVQFEIWGASEIEQRLIHPAATGLREYWFDDTVLTPSWFREKLNSTVLRLDERFHPEEHVEVEASELFQGLRCTSQWQSDLNASLERLRAHAPLDRIDEFEKVASGQEQVEASLNALLNSQSLVRLARKQPISTTEWKPLVDAAIKAVYWALERMDDALASGPDTNNALIFTRRLISAQGPLDDILESLTHFEDLLTSSAHDAQNKRCLFVFGRAGAGKSHYLAHEASLAIESGEPTIMLLGSDFDANLPPGEQLVRRLGLTTNFQTFLAMLNAAAEANDSRATVIIDALNEGAGAGLWRDRLSEFLDTVLKFDRLAISVSCRTEYAEYVIAASARSKAVETSLRGFSTPAEQERAAEIYMDRRGILRPSTPWPSPEFMNPLFLRTTCIALEADGRHAFPPGLRGTRSLISFYLDTAARHLGTQYDGSSELAGPLKRATLGLARAMARNRADFIERREASEILDHAFATFTCPPSSTWFDMCLRQGLLRSDPGPLMDDPLEVAPEIFRFGFQRFQDHLTAQALLDDVATPEKLFDAHGALAFMLDRFELKYEWVGVFQALFIEIADRWQRELVDLLPGDHNEWWRDRTVEDAFVESVRWRTPQGYSERTNELIAKLEGNVSAFDLLLELSPLADHPLNALRLHDLLTAMPLAQRDAAWTLYVNGGRAESGHPAVRLVAWCFGPGRSKMSIESLRLILIALGWLFSSTNGSLRDRATKAAVEILLDRSDLIEGFVHAFSSVDDPYISERVAASVAAACLRDPNPDRLEPAAAAIWRSFFAEGEPPVHLLLRDYARIVIELAAEYAVLPAACELECCRPPMDRPRPALAWTRRKLSFSPKLSGTIPYFRRALVGAVILGATSSRIEFGTSQHFA